MPALLALRHHNQKHIYNSQHDLHQAATCYQEVPSSSQLLKTVEEALADYNTQVGWSLLLVALQCCQRASCICSAQLAA
jgi:hypothetical protein